MPQKLYEQALGLRRQTFGENSAPYAAALVDLARRLPGRAANAPPTP